MIIVKTKNGSVLINDKETHLVEHLKDKSMVVVRSDQHKVNANIMDVESVTYVNDAHAMEYKDEGLEVERLKAELAKKERDISQMCDHFGFIREWFFIYQEAFDRISDDCKRAERENNGIYVNPRAIIEQAEKKYAESQKRFEKVREKWDKTE